MKRAILVLSLLFIGRTTFAQSGPPFDFRADLSYLHPEIIGLSIFQAWDGPADLLLRWGESRRDEAGRQVVFLQKLGPIPSAATLAVALRYPTSGPPSILAVRDYSSAEVAASYDAAEAKILGPTVTREDFIAVIPRPDPVTGTFAWEIHVKGIDDRKYVIPADGPARVEPWPTTPVPGDPHECTPGIEDASSENDLHHPTDPIMIKAAAVSNPLLVHESALRLCKRAFHDIAYIMAGLAEEFTDSDTLSQKREFGVCDDKAIVLISYLRANGIAARLKFALWNRKGIDQAHAFVEYYHPQEGKWFHLDPTWNVQNPAVYRTTPIDGDYVTDIRVVDVDWPSDARSSAPISTTLPDITGDGRLNPWGDFCYSPGKGGLPRPPYSQP